MGRTGHNSEPAFDRASAASLDTTHGTGDFVGDKTQAALEAALSRKMGQGDRAVGWIPSAQMRERLERIGIIDDYPTERWKKLAAELKVDKRRIIKPERQYGPLRWDRAIAREDISQARHLLMDPHTGEYIIDPQTGKPVVFTGTREEFWREKLRIFADGSRAKESIARVEYLGQQ